MQCLGATTAANDSPVNLKLSRRRISHLKQIWNRKWKKAALWDSAARIMRAFWKRPWRMRRDDSGGTNQSEFHLGFLVGLTTEEKMGTRISAASKLFAWRS